MEEMTKYGVETDDELTKEAERKDPNGEVRRACPLCGSYLDNGGACPTHGTEPFEGS